MESLSQSQSKNLPQLARTSSSPRAETHRQTEPHRVPAQADLASVNLRSSPPKPKEFAAKAAAQSLKNLKKPYNPFRRFTGCCTSQANEPERIQKIGETSGEIVEDSNATFPEQSSAFQKIPPDSTSGGGSSVPFLATEQRDLGARSSTPAETNKELELDTSGLEQHSLMEQMLSTLKEIKTTLSDIKTDIKTQTEAYKLISEKVEQQTALLKTVSSQVENLNEKQLKFEESKAVSPKTEGTTRARSTMAALKELVDSGAEVFIEPTRTVIKTGAAAVHTTLLEDEQFMDQVDSAAGTGSDTLSAVTDAVTTDLERRGALCEKYGGSSIPFGSLSLRMSIDNPTYKHPILTAEPKPFVVIQNYSHLVTIKQTILQPIWWFVVLPVITLFFSKKLKKN